MNKPHRLTPISALLEPLSKAVPKTGFFIKAVFISSHIFGLQPCMKFYMPIGMTFGIRRNRPPELFL